MRSLRLVPLLASTVVLADNWVNPNVGNNPLRIHFGDGSVFLGSAHVDDIISQLGQACPGATLNCVTTESSIDAYEIIPVYGRGGSNRNNIKIGLEAGGSYQQWLRNGLLDNLSKAVKKASKCRKLGMSSAEAKLDNGEDWCSVPDYWGISWGDDTPGNTNGPSTIFVKLSSSGGGSGACDVITTIGSSVAGAIEGGAGAGAVFSLFGLFCDAISNS